MRVLIVHEPVRPEANVRHVAVGLRNRGHTLGLLHGTGNGAADWLEVFTNRYSLLAHSIWAVCQHFSPDLIYVHKLTDLRALEALPA